MLKISFNIYMNKAKIKLLLVWNCLLPNWNTPHPHPPSITFYLLAKNQEFFFLVAFFFFIVQCLHMKLKVHSDFYFLPIFNQLNFQFEKLKKFSTSLLGLETPWRQLQQRFFKDAWPFNCVTVSDKRNLFYLSDIRFVSSIDL